MKILSFSIFDSTGDWQFIFYIRGLFFNCAMAKIVYPDFKIFIAAERSVYLKYNDFFQELTRQYNVEVVVRDEESLCKMMLWRMLPIFSIENEYVFPRDSDAIVTHRESIAVQSFIGSELTLHGLHDNPAHSIPLMGGMCGFKCDALREKYNSFDEMISMSPVNINKRGSDQEFLNSVVYKDFKDSARLQEYPEYHQYASWLSNLCIAFIGAAGCNEFETLRYLRGKGIDLSFGGIASKYKNIFYWS